MYPFFFFLTAEVLLRITAEPGSPTMPQIPQEAAESSAIPIPDQERVEDVSDSGELQLNPLDTSTERIV